MNFLMVSIASPVGATGFSFAGAGAGAGAGLSWEPGAAGSAGVARTGLVVRPASTHSPERIAIVVVRIIVGLTSSGVASRRSRQERAARGGTRRFAGIRAGVAAAPRRLQPGPGPPPEARGPP